MSIRSRLFATVALPVFAATFAVQPALAESLTAPFEVAQEGAEQPSPEELLLLKKRRKQAAEQGQAEEQQPQAEEEQAPRRKKRQQQAEEQQPAAEESAPRQAEEQPAPRRKKRQQQAEEQQPAAEEAAPRQAEEQPTPKRKKRQQQVEEQQPAAEEAAPKQAEEQPAPKRKKRQQQAEEQQPAAEEAAPKQAEEQQTPRKKRQQQAEEQQPAAEEGAPKQAEEQQAPRKKRQQQAEEQQPAAEEGAPKQAEEQQAPRKERQQQAEEQQPATEEGAPKQAEEQQVPRKKRQQQAEEQRQTEQPADQAGEGRQPVPGAEAPATARQGTGEQQQARPAPEVVDKRTEEEKVKIAKDPAATDDTVVLPVENGAAILDSDKDADNVGGNRAREARRKQREELRAKEESVAPPTDDATAQAAMSSEVRKQFPQRVEANLKEEGQRIDEAPAFAVPQTTNIVNNTVINNTTVNNTTINNNTNEVTEVQVVDEVEDRVILGVGDRIFVRGDDRPRLRRDSEETFYDQLPRDRVRETIVRPGGYRIVTIYNRYGDIVQRSRIDSDGNEYLMVYAPEYEEDDNRPAIVDVGYDLPPMRLTIPVEDYIVDVADDPDRDYYEFLSEPPVEQVERVYTIDEVRNSARLRDKVRRIDLDTIHFETGSAEVSMTQAKTLRGVADAMSKILEKDPGETFFIEGHTDAVGSDRDNLVLSDQRAESVAVLLTEAYGIPAENLVTQGYGERFLKVRTPEAEQENRRVTIRRVTPLVRPVAQR